MVQLNDLTTQVKSHLSTAFSKIKIPDHNNHSTSTGTRTGTSSESPLPTSLESLNHQTAKVVDVVFNTLFGACTGNSPNSPNPQPTTPTTPHGRKHSVHQNQEGMNHFCSNLHSTNDRSHIILSQKFHQNHTKKPSSKFASLAGTQTNSSHQENIESEYAQYYQDDHGIAARAVLMASEREEKEKWNRREKWEVMHRLAKEEERMMRMMDTTRNHHTMEKGSRGVLERRRARRGLGSHANDRNEGYEGYEDEGYYPTQQRNDKVQQRGATGRKNPTQQSSMPQHREHMQVNGSPFILAEVTDQHEHSNHHNSDSHSESASSYNYDDGISALSAHTLEEMAKMEAILQSRLEVEKEPKEQGFDISMSMGKDVEGLNLSTGDMTAATEMETDISGSKSGNEPPSPVETEGSRSTTGSLVDGHDKDEDYFGGNASGLGENDTDNDGTFTRQSSSLSSSNQMKKYPVQMARPRSSTTHIDLNTSSSHYSDKWRSGEQQYWSQLEDEDDLRSPMKNPKQDISLIPQKPKKKKKRRSIFNRRKNYMECDEFDDREYDI